MGVFGTIKRKMVSELEKGLTPTEVHISLPVLREMIIETDVTIGARSLVLLNDRQLMDHFNKGVPTQVYGLKLVVSSDSVSIEVI